MVGCTQGATYLDPETTKTGAQGIAAQLAGEADAMMHLLGFGQIMVAVLLLLLGWAAIRLIQGGVVVAWRVGLDSQRRLAPVRSAANVLIVGAVGYLLLRRFLVAAPVITLVALALATSASLLVLAQPIQNVWAGFLLSFRQKLREGDRVTIGSHVGIVRDVGLTQLQLRCADGAAIFVPNRAVLHEAVRVERAKNTVPVAVRLPSHRADPGPEIVRAARRSALLSPFRAAGTLVEVEILEEGEVQVVMQIWSERGVREAKAHLEARLRAVLVAEVPPSSPSNPAA